MLGKTFKRMTDELLEWQTKDCRSGDALRRARRVRATKFVVEIAFNEV